MHHVVQYLLSLYINDLYHLISVNKSFIVKKVTLYVAHALYHLEGVAARGYTPLGDLAGDPADASAESLPS